jgi:hypothetical protein
LIGNRFTRGAAAPRVKLDGGIRRGTDIIEALASGALGNSTIEISSSALPPLCGKQ